MTTQEEINQGMLNLLMMATDLLKEADIGNNNFTIAQNLLRQAFFKYLDLADCPFHEQCRQNAVEDHEPEPPIDVRGELD